MDTIEPSPELGASVSTMKPKTERMTVAHLMRKLYGESQAGEFECMLFIARKTTQKAVVVAVSDDVMSSHLCIYAQTIDSLAKTALGLGPLAALYPPGGAA